MAFTKIKNTQVEFLEQHLRGTDRAITARQAVALYGIKNIRARMTEMRHAGLRVRTGTTAEGHTAYRISARDVTGSRAARFI
jgi:hypothetical protein